MDQKQFFRISDLISRSLQQRISDTEGEELERWLCSSECNRKRYEQICREQKSSTDLKAFDEIRIRHAYKRFEQYKDQKEAKNSKRLLHHTMQYAAIVALPLLIVSFLFVMRTRETETTNRHELVTVPSTQVPTLVLSDGTEMALDGKQQEVIEQNGVAIKRNEDGSLSYGGDNRTTTSLIYNKLYVPCMCDYQFVLSDGTKVWVNADSEVRYPVLFGEKERTVYVTGEVYFKVTEDKTRPFYVILDGVKVEVLGTSFNTNSYIDNRLIDITLTEGAIKAYIGEKEILLTPDHQLRVDRANQTYEVRKVDVSIYNSWKSGLYIFRHARLLEIEKVLKRWYGVDFIFLNEKPKEFIYSGIVNKEEPIDLFLNRMMEISSLTYKIEGDIIYIR